MAAGRSQKSLLSRRRRADDEGEDDDGPVMVEDSQSEGSVISEPGDDDVDGSTIDGGKPTPIDGHMGMIETKSEAAANGNSGIAPKLRKGKSQASKKHHKDSAVDATQSQAPGNNFKVMADTEAMLNGLKIDESSPSQAVVDFDDQVNTEKATSTVPAKSSPAAPQNGLGATSATRNRREHEEYRKKRDVDPAFIPNRGNFFMHDNRSHSDRGSPPVRGAWNGRGRGKGSANVGGPFSPANQAVPAERAAEQPWKHDLHDTINEEPAPPVPSRPADSPRDQIDSARIFPKTGTHNQTSRPPALNFSRTTYEGTIQMRVVLPGMKAPIVFSEVPWKKYTRLPDHRPPLRRDKPVRISIAGHQPRYIFPSLDRSFVFIPRQMRPNQQGFGRNTYQRSAGGYGYSSRRTSMYGGSVYAGSVAASRRSSFASIARDNAFSPVGAYGGHMPPNRPVVRLPHGSQSQFSFPSTPMGPLSGQQTPTRIQVHTFPLPQQPIHQGTPSTTMHQPRPQKAISVTGIESPAAALQQQMPVPSEPQLFQNQLPAHMSEQSAYGQPQPFFPPQQQYQVAQQQPTAPSLSGIPEQSMHATAFQPPPMQYGAPGYYNPYQQPPNYYYPSGPGAYQHMPMYMPPAQNYAMPPNSAPMPPPQPPTQPPSQAAEHEEPSHAPAQSQSGIVAEERNGMVFYRRAAEAQHESQGEHFQPAESFVPQYAMPGLPPPTPAPEAPYFYPQMPPPGMQDVGSAMYYPAQSQQP